jgi:hypothetical protein
LPRPLWRHLLDRVAERQISVTDLQAMQDWVKSAPDAPDGDWYKDFKSFILFGTAEFPKTILTKGMKPYGKLLE